MLHVSHLAILAVSLVVWVVQFILFVLSLYGYLPGDMPWAWTLRFAVALDFLLGVALTLLLVRALYWHPRSKAQIASALRRERERIARELHDQVGSQIVNAMILFDSPSTKSHPVMQTLEQCMLDLRVLVDVMSDHKGNLSEKLGALRHRLQPVLDKRGIQLTWNMEVDQDENLPKGVRAKELCRLVQEAVSNVLQHSMATQLTIELRSHFEGNPKDWLLSVADNGVGMRSTARVGYMGRGLSHMKRRAMRAGGTMSVVTQPSAGTKIIVIVSPVEQESRISAAF